MPSKNERPEISLRGVEVILANGRKLFKIPRFDLPFGAHVLIQGPSGSGKTTLLHLLAGLFVPTAGEVLIGTHNLKTMSDDERCRLRRSHIGVIFQKLNLLEHMTIAENVGLLSAIEARGSIDNVLGQVNLFGRGTERCSHLSPGEQQRVAVARLLHQSPSVVLADEPTSSLDEDNADFVMRALKKSASGRTLVVVSHDRRLVGFFDQVTRFEELIR